MKVPPNLSDTECTDWIAFWT